MERPAGLNGVQQGVGLRYQNAVGSVTRTQVGDYQKNRGKGPTNVIAHNEFNVIIVP